MALYSTASIQKSFKYDVFLSFRGEDTRKNFVDHLYYALQQKSIHSYKDDERIEKGKSISDELIKSIEDSKLYIIVFSKNYASSSWCLDELLKIMECQKTIEHTAYPVFYDVEPTEVRKQSGYVGEAFARHEKDKAASKWREALKEAADLAGWELKNTANGHEVKFIQKVVEEILLELRFITSNIDGKLIGMETRVMDVLSRLETSFNDVRMLGIKGMGGGGKTTLARAVFDHISIQFEGISFVENVREVSKASFSGLKKLQKQVLSDLLNEQGLKIRSVYDGKNMMKKIMCGKKVLLVLDDVDDIEQLEALAGKHDWFMSGSIIIITTRDEQVLLAHGVNLIWDVNLLSHEEALCLFSRYAFGREIPVQGYQELSGQVVRYAAGLPLTIRVLGSFLCGKTDLEWIDALARLEKIPLKETQEKLELSYVGLEEDYKEIFLDVACLLKGEQKDYAIRVLESCGFHARNGLRVLELKSLITISDGGCLSMHDHIEEMGKNIVRRLHPDEPNKHSRLWIDEEIEHILANDLGTQATRCLKLWTVELNPLNVMTGLGNMKELRFLDMCCDNDDDFVQRDWNFDEDSQYLPNALRFMYWDGYPFWCLPTSFRANNLVILKLRSSRITRLWKGGERKVLNKLKFLDLGDSKLRTFDLALTPNLEMLYLDECEDLTELHMPLGCLKLKSICLNNSHLKNLNLGLTPDLETLNLGGCCDLVELHMPFPCPSLISLDLHQSKLRSIDLELTTNIERLDLKECYDLVEIHAPIGCLKKLIYLDLSGCLKFKSFLFDKQNESHEVPSLAELHLIAKSIDICPFHIDNNLAKFQFIYFYKEHRSASFGNLEKLISVGICPCTNLESFSGSICGLRCLRKLTLEGNITEAPRDLGQLDCLEELILSNARVNYLPDSLCMLKHLKYLSITSCWYLKKLPEDLGQLKCLENLILMNCAFLRDIPNSICNMKRLKNFHLPGCHQVARLPEDLGYLPCLKELNIEDTSISYFPSSIFWRKGLRIIGFESLLRLGGFQSTILISKYESFYYI